MFVEGLNDMCRISIVVTQVLLRCYKTEALLQYPELQTVHLIYIWSVNQYSKILHCP